MLLKAGKNNLTPNGKRKMQENTDKIKAEYKELKKSKTAVIKSLVSRAHKIYDTKGIDKEGMISDILVAKYGSAKVKAAFNESVDIDEAYIRAVDFQKAAKEVGKLKSGLDQNAINQISKLQR